MTRARIAALLAAALAVTGGASIAAGPDPEPAEAGRGGGQQPVQAVESDQAGSFSVLRRAARPEDRLRDQAVEFVRGMMTGDFGAAPGLVRRSQVTARNAGVYVIPGREFICVYTTTLGADEGTAGCNPIGEALQGHLIGFSWPAPGINRVVGLATDDVTEVRLRDAKGNVERVAPVNNTYVFETTMWPKQIEWGDEVFPVPAGLRD
jgi:hypothetical protein